MYPGPLAKKKWCPEPAGICSRPLSPFLSHMTSRQGTLPSLKQWGRAKQEGVQARPWAPVLSWRAWLGSAAALSRKGKVQSQR